MKTFFFKIHRLLGSILSLVFLMWFLSGFMMIYSRFPHVDKQKLFDQSTSLGIYANQITLPDIDTTYTLDQLTLEVVNDIPSYTVNHYMVNAITKEVVGDFSEEVLDSVVRFRYQSKIKNKKILTDFDTWIPWSDFKIYFPIHKYYLDDKSKTCVYVSQTTGKIVQETTLKTRWLARFGAIPHWFYFKSLRLHRKLWSDFIIWLSGIGAIMCLSGLVVGVYRIRKRRRANQKGLLNFSPYREKWYRWHHIVGLTFGVFTFTFVLSGMFSLMDVPKWLISVDENLDYQELWQENVNTLNRFSLPINKVLSDQRFSNVKKLQFKQINNKPYYLIYQNYDKPIFIPADRDSVFIKTFSHQEICHMVDRKLTNQVLKVVELKKADLYYNPKGKNVSKILLDDANKSWLYINLQNPTELYVLNKNKRALRWLYKGLHTFNIGALGRVGWLRKLLLIVVSTLGLVISLSGVVLTYRYLKRKKKSLMK